MRQLSVEWFKGVPADKRENFELAIRNSTLALSRLYDLITEWDKELDSAETKIDDFDTPNWALRQAYRNGDRSRLRKLRDLLSFLQGNIK